MAKQKVDLTFKNAEISLEENVIYEYDKNNELVNTHSMDSIWKRLTSDGQRVDFSINTASEIIPVSGE